ncbi:MAG: hypothetical protein EB824_05555 [Thaumarchaeota archaeon S15]|nr:MAG: hypothetical protein EB824_05555 [Thaumarchaeota archaeon S15]
MSLPLQVANGRFAARCSLQGNPDQAIFGVVDSGSTITCVDTRTCDRADLEFAGDSVRVRCVHRSHREVVRSYHGHIDICGRTAHTTVYELDMGPECERAGINAILGWDVLEDFRITMDMPSGTGAMDLLARE